MTFADPFSQTISSQANVARAVGELRRGGAVAVAAGHDAAPASDVPAPLCQAVIELVKAARLLPAAVVVPMPLAKLEAWVAAPFRLAAGDVIAYRRAAASGLKRVGSARVPLAGGATGQPGM